MPPDRPTTGPDTAGESHGPRARLFDADRTDRRLDLDEALRQKPGSNQLLWIDSDGPLDPDVVARFDDRLKLGSATSRALSELGTRPMIAVHGKHLRLRVLGEPDRAPAGSRSSSPGTWSSRSMTDRRPSLTAWTSGSSRTRRSAS